MVQILSDQMTSTLNANIYDLEENFKLKELKQASLISDLQEAFINHTDLTQILSNCAFAIVNHIGINSAQIWSVSDTNQRIDFQASYSQVSTTPTSMNVAPFIKQKKPFLVNKIEDDPGIHDRKWLETHEFNSWAGIPFVIDDKVIGILAMYSKVELAEETLEMVSPAALSLSQSIELKSRKQNLQILQEKLIGAQTELQALQDITISRELKMVDLKNQIKQLSSVNLQVDTKDSSM